jgi:predicted thioesterase
VTLAAGSAGNAVLAVTDADTAIALRSGDVAVLATPRLVALCEEATVAAVAGDIDPGQTTVGTRVELDHLRPSPVGAQVTASATLVSVDGRRLTFDVEASDAGDVVARGVVVRALVDRTRFEAS